MKSVGGIGLNEVQAVYSGAEGRLWELIMGEQIHIGGLASSIDLAEKAGIGEGMHGVDLCCCTGAGMRFLTRFRKVPRMTGVDATEKMISLGRQRCEAEKLADKIDFVLADVCDSHLPDAYADFVWGEDAWCYVEDKERLIAEAARLVKPGGVIAFTDWVENVEMSDAEADRFLRFMKFPSLMNLADYPRLLEANGCAIEAARDTGRFHPCIDLYLSMLGLQLTYDALKIIGFDQTMMAGLGGEMMFARELAAQGKLVQGLFVARRKE
jgi:SAM-dependent methyltransferase